jgi:hypothetical protein
LPTKLTHLNELRDVSKKLEQLQELKMAQIEEGMRMKQKNNAVIADMKSELEGVKEQLKLRAE